MDLKNLQKVIDCQWRVQSFSKHKPQAQCVAYIDARQVASLLDEVVGAENWQVDYKTVNGMLFAGIGIYINNNWIWKWDAGTESEVEKEKGHVSDSFKRAGVQWGIGRFLYDLDIQYLNANEKKVQGNYPYVIDDNNRRVWDITDYIQKKLKASKGDRIAVMAQKPTFELTEKSEAWIMEQLGSKELKDIILSIKKIRTLTPEVEKQINNKFAIIDDEDIQAELKNLVYGEPDNLPFQN
jgi:hypothetical protein